MTLADIKNQVQLRLEDSAGSVYSTTDIVRSIDTALQKIPSMLHKQYLSRLLHQQKISTGLSTSVVTQDEDSYIIGGEFTLGDLTANKLSGENGYELMYDQIESAFLLPNSINGLGRSIAESIVWIHITDQLGRYELENSYMYDPAGVTYQILPLDLARFGSIHVMYYMKPPKVVTANQREPEISSVAHESIIYFAVSELLASDGDTNRSAEMYKRGMDIISSLNSKVSNMDATKKQSNL